MEKLLKAGRNNYFLQINGQNYYFSPFNERADKKIENMVEITPRECVAKIDECVSKINELEERLK